MYKGECILNIYKTYKDDVKNIAGRYYKAYKYKILSFEDLEQTIWYILMCALSKFDGRGDQRNFVLHFIKQKLISILKNNRRPPYCTDSPFTCLCFDYFSADDENSKYYKEIHGEYE